MPFEHAWLSVGLYKLTLIHSSYPRYLNPRNTQIQRVGVEIHSFIFYL